MAIPIHPAEDSEPLESVMPRTHQQAVELVTAERGARPTFDVARLGGRAPFPPVNVVACSIVQLDRLSAALAWDRAVKAALS